MYRDPKKPESEANGPVREESGRRRQNPTENRGQDTGGQGDTPGHLCTGRGGWEMALMRKQEGCASTVLSTE